jgi:hypothetical protein
VGTFCTILTIFSQTLAPASDTKYFLAWLPLVLHDHDQTENFNFVKKILESGQVFFLQFSHVHQKWGSATRGFSWSDYKTDRGKKKSRNPIACWQTTRAYR